MHALERCPVHAQTSEHSVRQDIIVLQWEEVGMQSSQSCLGTWSQCTIPAPKDEDNAVQDCQLEFVVNGPNNGVDRPGRTGTESYILHGPGGYKLSSGMVRPFPQACNAPYMLVSPHLHLYLLLQFLLHTDTVLVSPCQAIQSHSTMCGTLKQ